MKLGEAICKAPYKGRMRPLKLKPTVKATTSPKKGAPCLNYMTAVMQCWKSNDFQDFKCGPEIQAFVECSEKAKRDAKAESGVYTSDSKNWWPHPVVNSNLKKLTSKR